MVKSEQEIEVKFAIRDLPAFAGRVEALGGRLASPRVRETNLRFDTPDGVLTREHRVLRLRQDTASVLTYKGAALPDQEVSSRQEIEFQVSSFDSARHFLEALGYHVAISYEKYRATYRLDDLTVTLDEMPFGTFAEIEGPDVASIRKSAGALGLDWEARCATSYLALFDILRETRGLTAQNLTFDDLAGTAVAPGDMGLRYADV